jgi:sirohydrochlorin cobaltochelatase
MGREIFAVLQGQLDRLMKQLAVPDPQTTGVILLGAARRTPAPTANWPRWRAGSSRRRHELVDLAFTGVTWPRLETVVQRQASWA